MTNRGLAMVSDKPKSPEREVQDRRMARTRRRLADPQVRGQLMVKLKAEYERGRSIRAVATDSGLAFGTTRNLLIEAGVTLRTRSGPRLHPQQPTEEALAQGGHDDRRP